MSAADQLRACIAAALAEIKAGSLVFEWGDGAQESIARRWGQADGSGIPGVAEPAGIYDMAYASVEQPREERRAPPWRIAFTSEFLKQGDKIDRKLQGRVYEAIAELSEVALAPHGDTIKPLLGEYKGYWRYRIGEFRLIFQPNKDAATMILIAFLPRGGAYD